MRWQDENTWQDQVPVVTRTLQIIVGALAFGLIVFLAVVLVVATPKGPNPPAAAVEPLIAWIAVGFAAMIVVLRVAVPAAIVSAGRKKILGGTPVSGAPQPSGISSSPPSDAAQLMALMTTRTIVAGALLEGAAFFNLIAYMLASQPMSLGVAILLILGVLSLFPTQSRCVRWIEDQQQWLDQERQFAR